jgi:hypothetical protein
MPGRLRLKSAAVMTLGVLALVSWFGFMFMTSRYHATCPRAPDTASGHVIPHESKGSVVYLDAVEDRTLDCLGWGAALLFLVGALLGKFGHITPKGPLDDLPKEVRDRILNSPPSDYEKTRRTYEEPPDAEGPNQRLERPVKPPLDAP